MKTIFEFTNCLTAIKQEIIDRNFLVLNRDKKGNLVSYYALKEQSYAFVCPGFTTYIFNDVLFISDEDRGYSMPANSLAIENVIQSLESFKPYKRLEFQDNLSLDDKPEKFYRLCILDNISLNLIKEAMKFPGKDELRPVMGCVFVDTNHVVASNSMKLIKIPHEIELTETFLIPPDAQKFLKSCKHDIQIFQSVEKIKFVCEDKVFITDRPQVDYPNYNAVIPVNHPYSCTFDRKELIEAVKKAAVYANQASNLVKMSLNGKGVISACDLDFSLDSKFEVGIENNTFEGEIGFKSTFLLDCLKASKSGKVTFHFTDPTSCVLIDNTLLMPMVINA